MMKIKSPEIKFKNFLGIILFLGLFYYNPMAGSAGGDPVPLEIRSGLGYHQRHLGFDGEIARQERDVNVRMVLEKWLMEMISLFGSKRICPQWWGLFLAGSSLLLNGPLLSADHPKADLADTFSLSQSTPTKIFTPNGDGINDTFSLLLNNPAENVISQKKIFDLMGAEISDFQVIGDETALLVTLLWDGRDKNGNYVRGGVYVYQVQSEGKVINGTVVVAR